MTRPPEHGGLVDQHAVTRVSDIKGEAKGALAEIAMRHREIAGCQPLWQRQPEASELDAIAGAAKFQRLVHDGDPQRHRDAEADIFLEPGRPLKTLGGVDDLRKAAFARADARPGLAAAVRILGDRHDHGHADVAAGWQRPADQARGLCEPPAEVTE
jgi:hypothetical protein